MKRYAFTDLHGCSHTFDRLLDQLDLQPDDQLYFLGDYVDRGPDSRGVLDRLMALEKQYQTVCLRGNHDHELLTGLCRSYEFRKAIFSYSELFGDKAFDADEVRPYIDWLHELPYYHELDDYILVHAGFDFSQPRIYDNMDAMIYIRDWYDRLDPGRLDGRVILHGHTPVKLPVMTQMIEQADDTQVIDLDGGCSWAPITPGYGALCCLELNERQLFVEHYCEPVLAD